MAAVVATGMLAGGCGSSGSNNPPPDGGASQTFKVVLLQTNDIHSNLEGHDAVLDFTPATANDDLTIGGIQPAGDAHRRRAACRPGQHAGDAARLGRLPHGHSVRVRDDP